ncbi:MAG: hypothetical protein KC636_14025 [Myxococcales bacterium]|nr:hypothetical protein [Myxococcales bacterium]
MDFRAFRTRTLLSTTFALLSGLVLGCVIGTGGDDASPTECGDIGSHSFVDGDQCFCEGGYTWCTSDPNDYDCCLIGNHDPNPDQTCGLNSYLDNDGFCYCEVGYKWVDDNSLDCEPDTAQTGTGSSGSESDTEGTDSSDSEGTTAGPTTGADCPNPYDPPAGSCDPQTELAFCTHPDSCGPEGSEYYLCDGGTWVLQDQAAQNQLCGFEGFDFSYGCVDDGMSADLVCGTGSGDPCSGDSCIDGSTLGACIYGKTSAQDCQVTCEDVEGPDGFYDLGECGDQGDGPQCLCSYEDTSTSDTDTTQTDTETDTTG